MVIVRWNPSLARRLTNWLAALGPEAAVGRDYGCIRTSRRQARQRQRSPDRPLTQDRQ